LADADLGGEVDDSIDILEAMRNDVLVADVADDQFGLVGQVLGSLAIAVDLLDQAIEYANLVASAKKLLANRTANEACTAGN
jgi:hypothetical protein